MIQNRKRKNKFTTPRKAITLEDVVYILTWLAVALALVSLIHQIGVYYHGV